MLLHIELEAPPYHTGCIVRAYNEGAIQDGPLEMMCGSLETMKTDLNPIPFRPIDSVFSLVLRKLEHHQEDDTNDAAL